MQATGSFAILQHTLFRICFSTQQLDAMSPGWQICTSLPSMGKVLQLHTGTSLNLTEAM